MYSKKTLKLLGKLKLQGIPYNIDTNITQGQGGKANVHVRLITFEKEASDKGRLTNKNVTVYASDADLGIAQDEALREALHLVL